MENRNKVQKQKKKFTIVEFTIIVLVIIIDFIFVFNYAEIVTTQKLLPMQAIEKTLIKVSNAPLKMNFKNKAVLSAFVETQKTLAIYYFIIILLIFARLTKPKSDFKGIEHGSAQWANAKEYEKYSNTKTIPIANNVFIDPQSEHFDNLNECIIGGSGSSKTFSVIAPTIFQQQGSFVCTDPKGELYRNTKILLEKAGYKVRVLNFIKPKYSNQYNPFRYIDLLNEGTLETDVLKLVGTFMANTVDSKRQGGDQFWDDSMKALLSALCFYLVIERPMEERNFERVFELVREAKPKDEDETGTMDEDNPLEVLFDELKEKDIYHPAVIAYDEFKLAAGKTAKSILISLAVRLNIWIAKDICIMTQNDEIEIEKIGTEKTAIFLIIPETENPYKALTAMFYSQLFQISFEVADYKFKGALPYMIDCEMDEFANIGEIPFFDQYIAILRSRNMRVSVVIQAISQLKKMYKEYWEIITSNCFAINFLGANDQETLKYISEKLGKATVRIDTGGTSKGKQSSRSENVNYVARDLMSTDELYSMNKKNSIVFMKGNRPFFTEKYDTAKHELYKSYGSMKFNPKYCVDIKEQFKEIAERREKEFNEKRRLKTINSQMDTVQREADSKKSLILENENEELKKEIREYKSKLIQFEIENQIDES